MTDEATLLTTVEAAIRLGMRLDYLYMLLRSGRIPATRKDGRWEIPMSSIEERLARRQRRSKLAPPPDEKAPR